MRINEVFDTPTRLHRADPKKIQRQTGLIHLVATWQFMIDDIDYLVYFDECSGISGTVTMGFGPMSDAIKSSTKYNVSHRPTGTSKTPLKILGNVIQALRTYIDQEKPKKVRISGMHGQYDLYKQMSRCLQVPDGYRVWADDRNQSIDIIAD